MKRFFTFITVFFLLGNGLRAVNYSIDLTQSSMTFTAEYLKLFQLTATCTQFSGDIHWHDGYPEYSSFQGTAEVKKISTGQRFIDKQLLSTDLFDEANYPQILFKSSSIQHVTANQFLVSGIVTAKGVSVEISEPLMVTKLSEKPNSYRLQTQFSVNRRDFEIGDAISTLIIGPKIKIKLDFVVKR